MARIGSMDISLQVSEEYGIKVARHLKAYYSQVCRHRMEHQSTACQRPEQSRVIRVPKSTNCH